MSGPAGPGDAQLLRKTVRDAFVELSPSTEVRRVMATSHGWDATTWRRLCTEVGVAGIAVDESHGGSGLTDVELGIVFEEAGKALLCAPLFAVAGLAIPMIVAAGDEAQKRWLPGLVDGSVVATVVVADRHGRHGLDRIDVAADGTRLAGQCGHVVDGGSADILLVPARTADGVCVYVVERTAPGVTVKPLVTLDQTRRQAHVALSDAPATALSAGDASDVVRRAFYVARVMLACEQVGVAQQCLDMTVAYARRRIQFGRPIGSFQAVKQKLADLLIRVESARSAATAAAQAAAGRSPELGWMASVAKAYCSEASMHAAAEAIQLHGGIGFTWEHDAHLYFKRARAGEEMLGTSREHYDRVAEHLAAL